MAEFDQTMEKMHGRIYLGHEPPVEGLGFEERVERPGFERVRKVRIAYFMIVFLTLYLAVYKFSSATSIKRSLVDLDIYMRPEFLGPEGEDVVASEIGDLSSINKSAIGYQPQNQMEFEAMSERAGMQATLELSILADIITAGLFLVTTIVSVTMSYNRTCGMVNAEYRGMAICTLACLSMAFSIICGVVGATIYQDKSSELMSLPAFDNPKLLVDMGRMIWLEFGGGAMTCLSNIMLGAVAVYYADEHTGDSLYLPVRQRPISGLDFWEPPY